MSLDSKNSRHTNCLPTLQIASVGLREHVLVVLQPRSLRYCHHWSTLTIEIQRCTGGSNLQIPTTSSSLVNSRPGGCGFLSTDYKKFIINGSERDHPCPANMTTVGRCACIYSVNMGVIHHRLADTIYNLYISGRNIWSPSEGNR